MRYLITLGLFISFLSTRAEYLTINSLSDIYTVFSSKPDTTPTQKSNAEIVRKTSSMEGIEKKNKEHFKFSLKFNLPVENVSNLSLFNFISEWYGTKYLFGGTSKKGIDCSAFTRELVRSVFNLELPRVVTGQFTKCIKIAKDDLKPGDLVFFETYRPGLSHVGYYLGDNKFIHAASKGVTIDDLDNSYYKKRFRTGGRIKDLQ